MQNRIATYYYCFIHVRACRLMAHKTRVVNRNYTRYNVAFVRGARSARGNCYAHQRLLIHTRIITINIAIPMYQLRSVATDSNNNNQKKKKIKQITCSVRLLGVWLRR